MTKDYSHKRNIPNGYTKVTYQEPVDAVVYVKQFINHFAALGFRGKAGKSSFHYRFNTREKMNEYIVKFFNNCIEHDKTVKARKDKESAYEHDYVVGEILTCSWGYDQTNVDFYQVTAVPSKKSIKMRKIGAMVVDETNLDMQDYLYPVRDQFKGEEMLKRVSEGGYVKIASYAWASKWDYNKVWSSSYA